MLYSQMKYPSLTLWHKDLLPYFFAEPTQLIRRKRTDYESQLYGGTKARISICHRQTEISPKNTPSEWVLYSEMRMRAIPHNVESMRIFSNSSTSPSKTGDFSEDPKWGEGVHLTLALKNSFHSSACGCFAISNKRELLSVMQAGSQPGFMSELCDKLNELS